jgi:hypothetical protein
MTGVEETGLEMSSSVLSVYKLKNVNLRRRILEEIIKQMNNAEVTRRTSCLSAQLFDHFLYIKRGHREKSVYWADSTIYAVCRISYTLQCDITYRSCLGAYLITTATAIQLVAKMFKLRRIKLFLYPRPYRIFRTVFSLCSHELLAHSLTHQPQDCWLSATAYLTCSQLNFKSGLKQTTVSNIHATLTRT